MDKIETFRTASCNNNFNIIIGNENNEKTNIKIVIDKVINEEKIKKIIELLKN